MARPEITGRKPSPETAVHDDADAFSVTEFCRRNRISVQLYYKLKPQGLMPSTFCLGARVLISREAAAVWRREREAADSSIPNFQPYQLISASKQEVKAYY